MASSCPSFPQGKVREIIEETNETGKEHGFVRCADGSVSKVVSGGEDRMNISDAVKECDLDAGPIDVVHTHPNGTERLSAADREVATHEDVGSVCVAVDGGKVVCEMVDNCEFEVGE